ADPGDVAAVLRLLDALRGAAAPARELRPLPHPARPGTHRPRPLAAGGPRRLLPGPPPHGRRPPVAGARRSFLFLPGFLPGRGCDRGRPLPRAAARPSPPGAPRRAAR